MTPPSPERIPTFVVDDHDELGIRVATRIAALVRERAASGRPVVLGLATGSTPVGRTIAAACGELLRPVTLELGGKSSALVLPDADLDAMSRVLVRSRYLD